MRSSGIDLGTQDMGTVPRASELTRVLREHRIDGTFSALIANVWSFSSVNKFARFEIEAPSEGFSAYVTGKGFLANMSTSLWNHFGRFTESSTTLGLCIRFFALECIRM